MIKDLLARGDMFNLLRILGGLCLVRNKLWFYNESIVVEGRTRDLLNKTFSSKITPSFSAEKKYLEW